ncbi:hypothetical protein FPRO04_08252 [Fusarium proliferatum]|uniref:Uncharacterized protein n=1 Tax=Gibberella intermedia TaxID=948311 RepID=A0A365N4Z7_GIBIN|nr:hypothetical protein FPRO03_11815 [Fusarium proliferatum]KAG4275738.1 hypothetical protein FPRO04_08252 [Fusarium proliferatum]RBA15762.1 hypothetical protein FPRO05_12369 [Fusarium proliferatum]CVL05657.1 uncharacterized protein FPRN_14316 [Fusarium proliferatum]
MDARSQPPARSTSRTQIYIVVNSFSSHEELDLPPGNFFFDARNLWSIVMQRPYHALMQYGLFVDGDSCRNMAKDQVTMECPERQLLSTDPENADDTWECNRKWVRDILGKLLAGRIRSNFIYSDFRQAEESWFSRNEFVW